MNRMNRTALRKSLTSGATILMTVFAALMVASTWYSQGGNVLATALWGVTYASILAMFIGMEYRTACNEIEWAAERKRSKEPGLTLHGSDPERGVLIWEDAKTGQLWEDDGYGGDLFPVALDAEIVR